MRDGQREPLEPRSGLLRKCGRIWWRASDRVPVFAGVRKGTLKSRETAHTSRLIMNQVRTNICQLAWILLAVDEPLDVFRVPSNWKPFVMFAQPVDTLPPPVWPWPGSLRQECATCPEISHGREEIGARIAPLYKGSDPNSRGAIFKDLSAVRVAHDFFWWADFKGLGSLGADLPCKLSSADRAA